MARPRVNMPPGARQFILECAADRALSETAIARGLGMSYRTWKRLLRDNEDAKALWREALATERDNVLQKLFERSMEGDTGAAKFLLAARHGLSENNGKNADSGRGNVVINLPSPVTAAQYKRMIQVEPDALEDGSDD